MSYRKGYRFEWEVKKFLEKKGYYVIRSAGSKKPDIIAGKDGEIIVVECKYTAKSKLYLPKDEVNNLIHVASMFRAKPVYLIKKKNSGLFVVEIHHLKELNGRYFLVDLDKLTKNK